MPQYRIKLYQLSPEHMRPSRSKRLPDQLRPCLGFRPYCRKNNLKVSAMNRGATMDSNSSMRGRRSFPWIRRKSPSRSKRNRQRSIELSTSSRKSIFSGGASVSSHSKGKIDKKSLRSCRSLRPAKLENLADPPNIRPGLSTQGSWKLSSSRAPAPNSPENSDNTSKELETESLVNQFNSSRKTVYVPSGAFRAERLPVSGPPRTIVAENSGISGDTQSTLLRKIFEPDADLTDDATIAPDGSIVADDVSEYSETAAVVVNDDSPTEIPSFLDETNLYSDSNQALSATRGDTSPSVYKSDLVTALPSLTISEEIGWDAPITTVLNDVIGQEKPRRQFSRENSSKSRHSLAVSEATSLAESSALYSTGNKSSVATSLDNSSFSRPHTQIYDLDADHDSATSLNLDQLGDLVQSSAKGSTDPSTARRLAEIEREKEMLELAIQRSLNDSSCFLYQPRSPVRAPRRLPPSKGVQYSPPNPLQCLDSETRKSKSKKSRSSNSTKHLGMFLEERIAEDQRAAELIAENELLELAMERSIADASLAADNGTNHLSISSIYFDAPQPPQIRKTPLESFQEEYGRGQTMEPANPQEVSQSTASSRRPKIRNRSVEIVSDIDDRDSS